MSESDVISLAENYENQIKQLKDELFRLSWYMRGGVSYESLMYELGVEDRKIINSIVRDNIETTNKTKLPLL
jgi:hypothetical protein